MPSMAASDMPIERSRVTSFIPANSVRLLSYFGASTPSAAFVAVGVGVVAAVVVRPFPVAWARAASA